MTLLESTKLNLESVSQSYRAQAELVQDLREQLAKLEAVNSKLTNQFKYADSMMKTYRQSYNDLKRK